MLAGEGGADGSRGTSAFEATDVAGAFVPGVRVCRVSLSSLGRLMIMSCRLNVHKVVGNVNK